MSKKPYKILSVGGSIIIPHDGFNIGFLKKFRTFILNQVKKGEQFILVVGGGGTARQYQQAAGKVTKLSDRELDWVGIHTTKLNAEFVKAIFKEHAYGEVITNPTHKINTNKPIIIAAGWKPGCSTDYDAVLLAKTYGATELFNLSNIEYVYDKDPNKYSDAKKITEIDWAAFRKNIVGNTWEAGKNAPFDPIASREAQKLGLKVSILRGTNLANVGKAIAGKKFIGTSIAL